MRCAHRRSASAGAALRCAASQTRRCSASGNRRRAAAGGEQAAPAAHQKERPCRQQRPPHAPTTPNSSLYITNPEPSKKLKNEKPPFRGHVVYGDGWWSVGGWCFRWNGISRQRERNRSIWVRVWEAVQAGCGGRWALRPHKSVVSSDISTPKVKTTFLQFELIFHVLYTALSALARPGTHCTHCSCIFQVTFSVCTASSTDLCREDSTCWSPNVFATHPARRTSGCLLGFFLQEDTSTTLFVELFHLNPASPKTCPIMCNLKDNYRSTLISVSHF